MFQATISKISKVKELTEKEFKYKVKVAVLCLDSETKKYATEHCEIKFATDADRKGFVTVFSALIDQGQPANQ